MDAIGEQSITVNVPDKYSKYFTSLTNHNVVTLDELTKICKIITDYDQITGNFESSRVFFRTKSIVKCIYTHKVNIENINMKTHYLPKSLNHIKITHIYHFCCLPNKNFINNGIYIQFPCLKKSRNQLTDELYGYILKNPNIINDNDNEDLTGRKEFIQNELDTYIKQSNILCAYINDINIGHSDYKNCTRILDNISGNIEILMDTLSKFGRNNQ